MKYRTAGLLSLGLTAVATLTFYNIASTRAQPPLGSASRNSDNHNHDHDHDGHNHSRQQSSEPPAPNANAIIAPIRRSASIADNHSRPINKSERRYTGPVAFIRPSGFATITLAAEYRCRKRLSARQLRLS